MSESAFDVKRLRRQDIESDPRPGLWVHAGDYNMILRRRDEALARSKSRIEYLEAQVSHKDIGIDSRIARIAELEAQRDEGLAREAEFQAELASAKADKEAYGHNAVALRLRVNQLKQRMAEADSLIDEVLAAFQLEADGSCVNPGRDFIRPWAEKVRQFASPGCSDALKAAFEAPVLCGGCHHYTSSPDHFDEAGKCKARPGCADGEQSIRLPSGGGKYAATLEPFATMMERELHANAAKGDRPGWLRMTPGDCLLEIYYHVAKLQKAVRDKDSERVAENTADVANLAMMMADIWGLLDCCADAEKTP